jgi:hypothetical protein
MTLGARWRPEEENFMGELAGLERQGSVTPVVSHQGHTPTRISYAYQALSAWAENAMFATVAYPAFCRQILKRGMKALEDCFVQLTQWPDNHRIRIRKFLHELRPVMTEHLAQNACDADTNPFQRVTTRTLCFMCLSHSLLSICIRTQQRRADGGFVRTLLQMACTQYLQGDPKEEKSLSE